VSAAVDNETMNERTTLFTKRPLVKLKYEYAGQYLIASNDTVPKGRFAIEDDNTQQRGLNKMAKDVRKLEVKNDAHTTKIHRRESDVADNEIHRESYGRQTLQNEDKCFSATTLKPKQ
jgi:deferrochelatase/peroxidase EfeB